MRISTHATTVRRLLVLCCLCAAPLAGAACAGADESTAAEPPAQSAAALVTEPASGNTGDSEAEEIVTRFLEAYGTFDSEQAITYLARDADISGLISSVGAESVGGTPDELRLLLSFLEAESYKQILHGCDELGSSASGTYFNCPFDFHAIRSDEIGLGPFGGSSFFITVRDGGIISASKSWGIAEFSPQMWEPFADWVSKAYPEDVEAMYTGAQSGVQLTEKSVRLWDQHIREYVEALRFSGPLGEISP
jgi:hypothetical protein